MNGLRRGILWVLGGAALAAVLTLVVWALPSLLTRSPSAGSSAAERMKAINDARASLIALAAGLGVAVGAVFAARTYMLSRSIGYADLFARAVQQIASDKLEVRVGGIHALHALAKDSQRRQPVTNVLTAFVRSTLTPEDQPLPVDVQVAMETVCQPEFRDLELDLTGARLSGVKLKEARLLHANFSGADLSMADLSGCQLRGAKMVGTDLRGALLDNADCSDADLTNADLRGASIGGLRRAGAKTVDALFDSEA